MISSITDDDKHERKELLSVRKTRSSHVESSFSWKNEIIYELSKQKIFSQFEKKTFSYNSFEKHL